MRHDANTEAITGIEIDYDAEKMSFDSAVSLLHKARLKFLIYTSPSHTDAAPRWRVLLPTSQELTATDTNQIRQLRIKSVARVNGLLGGVISGESFTLSQSFFYGRIGKNSKPPRCEYYNGDFIDLRPDLDAGALGKQRMKAKSKKTNAFEDYLARLGDGPGGDGFGGVLRSATAAYARMHGKNFDRDALKARLRAAIKNAPQPTTQERQEKVAKYLADEWLDSVIETAIYKFADAIDEDIAKLNEDYALVIVGNGAAVMKPNGVNGIELLHVGAFKTCQPALTLSIVVLSGNRRWTSVRRTMRFDLD